MVKSDKTRKMTFKIPPNIPFKYILTGHCAMQFDTGRENVVNVGETLCPAL